MECDGRFAPVTLGERLRERDLGWFAITEAVHRPGSHLCAHAHRFPAITMVRRGGFGLHLGGETIDCHARGVFFKRGGHDHANAVRREGARSLILEIRSDHQRVEERGLPLPDESFWTGDGHARYLARGVERELDGRDVASDLALEGLVLELVAALLRRSFERPEPSRPPWLAEVEAVLHEHFRESLGLSDVAASVGRHPVHIARTFRRHHGCSLGEYLRRIRLERAARLLRDTERPLGQVALDAGFYDHAHFCRCFKAWAAVSPGEYRRGARR